MEMDLDLDFDLEDDKIKSFLQDKLNEIKAKNHQLEQTLQDRRQFTTNMLKNNNVQETENIAEISAEVWKIFNGKYVVGVTVTNKSYRHLRNLKVLLNWDSKHPLSYQVHLYGKCDSNLKGNQSAAFCNDENCKMVTNSLKTSNEIDKMAYLVITFDQPGFTDKISYNITGDVYFQQEDNEISVKIPSIEISPLDATNHHLKDFPLSEDSAKDVLTVMSATVKTNLVMITPTDWNSSIDSTLEILCSLVKIDVPSRCRRFFVARRLSSSFDDSLIEIHAPSSENPNILSLTIYTKDSERVIHLLHHLHRNIPGVVIIPKLLYENYALQHDVDVDGSGERRNLKKFNECVDKEIKHVKRFLGEFRESRGKGSDVVKFRLTLADLEKCTDLYYMRLCNTCGQVINTTQH